MADAARLLERFRTSSDQDDIGNVSFLKREEILSAEPRWDMFNATRSVATQDALSKLKPDLGAETLRGLFKDAMVKAVLQALCITEDIRAVQYVLTILYDAVREDASFYSVFEECYGKKLDFLTPLSNITKLDDAYASDKAVYLMTAIASQEPRLFNLADNSVNLGALIRIITGSAGSVSMLGALDGITNLLKNSDFREEVWSAEGVSERIFSVTRESSPALIYKSVFAIWLLSFNENIAVTLPGSLKTLGVASRLKDVLANCRVEKVVRIGLSVLKNLLRHKALSEEVVEKGTLDVVNQLEFEKWRDGELYDEIKDVSHEIATKVKELSSFERYEKELATGDLHWGFIHSDRFWQENITKFEKDSFAAIKNLGKILVDAQNATPTTLAVACHDIGEFASLHPLGKRKVQEFMIKESIMQLMQAPGHKGDGEFRDLRREALLCCQKIMLDRWQVAATAGGP